MIQLPKTKRDLDESNDVCKCRPICKSRRREWKGLIQDTSAELLLERKPLPECFKKWPSKVYPNSPCPLQKRIKGVTIKEKYSQKKANVVRICQAPIDDTVPTPYLRAAELAKEIGALQLVDACCPFCKCGTCCPCGSRDYPLHDPDREANRRQERHKFDSRVKTEYLLFRNMYDWDDL